MSRSASRRILTTLALLWMLLLASCVRPDPNAVNTTPPSMIAVTNAVATAVASGEDLTTPVVALLGTPLPQYDGVPTPDTPHYDSASAVQAGGQPLHTVNVGETLGIIAQQYGTTVEELVGLNNLDNPDIIHVGQQLVVPGEPVELQVGPAFKIIPDSELVYGPAAADFDLTTFLTTMNSHLLRYTEEVEGQTMTGPQIVQLIADRYSVNPRLLLSVLEYRAGWVTQASAPTMSYILGYRSPGVDSLYGQLNWAANLLNLGFYGRSEGGLHQLTVDGGPVLFDPTINDGTAGVQLWLASHNDATLDIWLGETGPDGFFAAYTRLFGNPFAYTVEPLLPDNLEQPELALPWAEGETWYFTGGPHGAWNTGSSWGALDFAPPGDQLGCVQTDLWTTAMADGIVTRSGNGAVVVDLDGDGYAGTGWAITYMHLETRDRIPVGTDVKIGDRLGHPSCEGGVSNGTHVHLVRSYNGRWINADGDLPFIIGGWVSQGLGSEYDGYLVRGDEVREACACRDEMNTITR
ncbi:MAG: LysM peptidoglycan-binding domain-containing protein [Chloroflexota bacterium]